MQCSKTPREIATPDKKCEKTLRKIATPGLPQPPRVSWRFLEPPGSDFLFWAPSANPINSLSRNKSFRCSGGLGGSWVGQISCFGHPPQTLSILNQKPMISVLWRPGRLLGQISCFGHPPTTLSNPYYLVAPIHSANGHRKVSRCGDLPHRCSWRPPPQKELAK